MLRLYSLGISIYGFLLGIAALFVPKAKKLITGRNNTFQAITEAKRKFINEDWIWIHAASLGEFEQGRYLIEKLKTDHPEYRIALSFYSPSGYEARKDYKYCDLVFYLPLDSPKRALKLVDELSPKLAVFIKYDFWWNHLKALQIRKIPTVFISAMFRKEQYFVKHRLGSIRSILQGINHYFVQTPESYEILKNMNISQAIIAGDSRLDSIINERPRALNILEQIILWKKDGKCIIYGSVHRSDISSIRSMQMIEACHLIVPHDVDEANITHFKKAFPNSSLYSDSGFEKGNSVILDVAGALRYIYQESDMVYIGGGFGSGIHNILEPLVYHKPILIGPKFSKFPEAADLVAKDAVRTFSKPNEAFVAANEALKGYNNVTEAVQKEYIRENSGATEIILQSLIDNHWI